MKRKRIVLILVAMVIAAALLAVYYFYLGREHGTEWAAAAGPSEQFQYRIAEECVQ